MRYALPTDKLINRLTPYYLCGRRYLLFLQSLVWPLYTLNERFQRFAQEKHIEARMTSQIIYFEWYLNYRFGQYLENSGDRIYIYESDNLGVDLYFEDAENGRPYTVWYQGEEVFPPDEQVQPRPLYRIAEEKQINKVSFMVCVPPLKEITMQEFVYLLSYAVNTYRLAGKTYLIRIDQQEILPNSTLS